METIKAYLDKIFAGAGNIPEVKDLYDEIMDNCGQRYQEYLDRGLDAEKAASKVIAGLGDLQTLVMEMASEKGRPVRQSCEPAPSLSSVQYGTTINQLDICVRSQDICLERTDSSEMDVYASNRIEQQVENGTLYLQEKHDRFAWYFTSQKPLVIRVPEHFNKIHVKSVSGDIACDHLAVQNMHVETISGDISGTLEQVGNFHMATASGDIDLDMDGSQIAVCFETASGDVDCRIRNFRKMKINTASGDIDLETRNPFQQLTMNTVSGDIDLSAMNVQGLHICTHTISGDVENTIPDGSDGEVKMHTVSGDINLHA